MHARACSVVARAGGRPILERLASARIAADPLLPMPGTKAEETEAHDTYFEGRKLLLDDGVDQYLGAYQYQSSIDFDSPFWCDSSRRLWGYLSIPAVPGRVSPERDEGCTP